MILESSPRSFRLRYTIFLAKSERLAAVGRPFDAFQRRTLPDKRSILFIPRSGESR